MEIVVHWDRNILILSGDNEKFAGFVPFYFLYFFFFLKIRGFIGICILCRRRLNFRNSDYSNILAERWVRDFFVSKSGSSFSTY